MDGTVTLSIQGARSHYVLGVVHANAKYAHHPIDGSEKINTPYFFEAWDTKTKHHGENRTFNSSVCGTFYGVILPPTAEQISMRFHMTSFDEPKIGRLEAAREWKMIIVPLSEVSKTQITEDDLHYRAEFNIQVFAELRDPERLKKSKRKHSDNSDFWPCIYNEFSTMKAVTEAKIKKLDDPVKIQKVFDFVRSLEDDGRVQ